MLLRLLLLLLLLGTRVLLLLAREWLLQAGGLASFPLLDPLGH